MPTAHPSSLHGQLRAATAISHRALEGMLDLLGQPLERQRLVDVLVRFHGFHQAWEQAPAGCQLPAGLRPPARLPLLEQDLRRLGLGGSDMLEIAPCAAAASLGADPETALGSVYVLEGSTLGGRVIGRHFAQADWYPAAGLRYFDPYGAATGARWRATIAQLEEAEGEADRIVAGAVRTFEILHAWLA